MFAAKMPLRSLGLAGDGDEVEALTDVERELGVQLNYSNAQNWRTVGDVYQSLLARLPENVPKDASTWTRFCLAICRETAADSDRVLPETLLLAPALSEQIRGWLR